MQDNNFNPFFFFKKIPDENIYEIYIHSKLKLPDDDSIIKSQLINCKVLWLYIKNNMEENIKKIEKCISCCPPKTNLIFQWKYNIDEKNTTNGYLVKIQKLSDVLNNTGINIYAAPFLLFIDPIDNFIGNSDYNSLLYNLFFSSSYFPNLLYNYLSLYFLHTCNTKITYNTKKMQKRKKTIFI